MLYIYKLIILFLLFSPLISYIEGNYYQLVLGTPLNITNLTDNEHNKFLLKAKYQQELRIKIIIPNEIEKKILEERIISIWEYIDINDGYYLDCKFIYFSRISIRYNSDNTIRILFNYYVRNINTNFLKFLYLSYYRPKYFYIIVELAEHYDINTGIVCGFDNLLEHYENKFFISGVKRFQRINVSLTVKSSEFEAFELVYIKEFSKRPGDFADYGELTFPDYNLAVIDKIDNISSINFIYDIQLYPIVVLSLRFKCDIYYLNISVNVFGGEIIFEENNITKTITDIKADIPYYFSTKTTQFQTLLISLYTRYLDKPPFTYVDIYEYKNKSNKQNRVIKKQNVKYKIVNNDILLVSFKYKNTQSSITDIGFKFISNYDLDYIDAKMNIMGGTYYMNDGDIQKFINIYPECEFFIWIKMSQFQIMKMNIKSNYLKENPINNVDIYEYLYQHNSTSNILYKNITQSINYDKKNNEQIFIYFSYMVEYLNTKYISIKINLKDYLDILEIKINIIGNKYNLLNLIIIIKI